MNYFGFIYLRMGKKCAIDGLVRARDWRRRRFSVSSLRSKRNTPPSIKAEEADVCLCVWCSAKREGRNYQSHLTGHFPELRAAHSEKIPRAARSTPKLENFSCAAHPSSAVCAQGKRCNCVDKMKCVIYILMADFRQLSKLYYVDYFPECMEIYAVWFSQCFKMMGVSLYIFLVYTKKHF